MANKRIPLTVKKMKLYSIAACALGDFLIFTLTYYTFTAKEMMQTLLNTALAQNNIDPAMIAKQDILTFYQVITNTVLTMLIIYIIFHALMYFLLYKDKATARGYVLLYAVIGCFGAGATGVGLLFKMNIMALPILIQAVMYAMAFKYLRVVAKSLESENDTALASPTQAEE